MSSFVYIDNKGKDIIILGKGTTQGLEVEFSIFQDHFLFKPALYWEQQFFIFNATKIYEFNAKHSEIKKILCLGNVSEDFSANNMKKNNIE